FEEGLRQAVVQVSALLATHFALLPGEVNLQELPDRPSVDED
ncbi:MAG: TPM domain-containing protein, partial [Rhodoferax sp.]|nr:TPM domain-containing protein [Rhodoferax sp.]